MRHYTRKIGITLVSSEVKEGVSKKFLIKKGRENIEGFVFRRKGNYYAYRNRCQHVSLPLDWGDNDFFTIDKRFLACKNHGALYLPETGECVSGPCAGRFLESLEITLESGKLFIR